MELKTVFAQSNLTQNEIAKSLGVSQQLVSRWALGKSKPRPRETLKLSALLNISVETILKYIEK